MLVKDEEILACEAIIGELFCGNRYRYKRAGTRKDKAIDKHRRSTSIGVSALS